MKHCSANIQGYQLVNQLAVGHAIEGLLEVKKDSLYIGSLVQVALPVVDG